MKKIIYSFIVLLFLILYPAWQWIPKTSSQLKIAVLNVGQGDSIYLRTPAGMDILIDGGPDRKVLSELGEVMPPYDHQIELVIATHGDSDHIAGLAELSEAYSVKTLITNGDKKDTAFTQALSAWREQGVEVWPAYRGWHLELEQGITLDFLNPNPPNLHKDTNDNSVVCVLSYQGFSALFMGDAPLGIEDELLKAGLLKHVDILKVGHHGSRTSTGSKFLQTLTPAIALISVGFQNKFGHPHAAPLLRLKNRGVNVFRTDLQGRIICQTDGQAFSCQGD
ncbi:MAG: hypothetical protein A2233_05315 [Candidatus Kerfeldbacteria bacterium RIFOXYA2_FULL_38_24]|uniref:Metallo-beta-lactamase domain-containing protein n=1 Tax=Candidatus Kerfeldbacteria bacterium RIFOXYB2_FULL_38_14 TaxID=1798547 RepID=A0A1G2BI71_9BACT|nr:MAG: hypothetical protein A2233_05315 [Candidatus Kerfeldbacteria bacterium RIFOXYA2_FULL_38_24]OGY88249.1 MAG: hypothetical protein A2319_03610 [Candidatus Kerfeldbacteria bacterium RIFOXYB2_FULL_38_14]